MRSIDLHFKHLLVTDVKWPIHDVIESFKHQDDAINDLSPSIFLCYLRIYTGGAILIYFDKTSNESAYSSKVL